MPSETNLGQGLYMSSTRFLLNLHLRDCKLGGMTPAFVCRNEPTSLFEQAIHLFKRNSLGLWQKRPEENSIRDIADNKEEEIPPAL